MKKESGQEVYQRKTDGITVIQHERFQPLRGALNVVDLVPAALRAEFIDLAMERAFANVPEK